MIYSRDSVFHVFVGLMSLILVFSGGCAQKQAAFDLYVDAVLLNEQDKPEEAIEKLDTSVELYDQFSLAHSLLGQIYHEMQDYERSASSYEKATELNPWSFNDFFSMGRVYDIMEKFTKAAQAYVHACELKPDHLEAHIGAAKDYYKLEDYDTALVYGQRAEEIDPDVTEIQELLGDIYGLQRDYEQAIRSYKRALELDSNNVELMTSLAVVYLRTDRNEPAKELLTLVLEIEPDNHAAYQYLGFYYLRFYERTGKEYKHLRETNSGDVASLLSLEGDMNKFVEEAIKSYSKAIEINDQDWEAQRGLGVAYAMKGTNRRDDILKAKAVDHWRLSLGIKPDQPNRKKLVRLIKKYSK